MARTRYTVITNDDKGLTVSRLGRWTTKKEAYKVADLWKRHGLRPTIISTDPKERSVERDPSSSREALIRRIYERTPRDYRLVRSGKHLVMLGERSGYGHSLTTLESLTTSELERLARR